jgi:hypothetical protein
MPHYQELIKKAKAHPDMGSLARATGYHNPRKFLAALEAFQGAGSLEAWMRNGHYDMVHGTKSFVVALAEALQIPTDEIVRACDEITDRFAELAKLPTPWIYVETSFRRKGEPVFVLACMEGMRRLRLSKETIVELPLNQALNHVAEQIRTHYEDYDGVLTIWGRITGYRYHHIDGSEWAFATDGELQNSVPLEGVEQGATVTIRGRNICGEGIV